MTRFAAQMTQMSSSIKARQLSRILWECAVISKHGQSNLVKDSMLTMILMLEFPRIYISFLKLWTVIFELPGRRGAFAPTGGENMSPHVAPLDGSADGCASPGAWRSFYRRLWKRWKILKHILGDLNCDDTWPYPKKEVTKTNSSISTNMQVKERLQFAQRTGAWELRLQVYLL